jgi:aldose 1-epimerase
MRGIKPWSSGPCEAGVASDAVEVAVCNVLTRDAILISVVDGSPRTLAAGELEAVFLPEAGMLGASLRDRGKQLLGRVEDLEAAAAKGSTAGIPLLHPWANRLAGLEYEAAGRSVRLDGTSPLLHLDGNGLPIHGVPWARLELAVTAERADALSARLDWVRPELLGVFPYPHLLELEVALDATGLTIDTTVTPTSDVAVPVSFGFHPYFVLPDVPRAEWRLELPPMERLALDERGIPTGERGPFAGFAGALGARTFDDGFAVSREPTLALVGGGRRIEVSFLEGYRYAQVFAPPEPAVVALEPMTAPTNALVSGDGLTLVPPGGRFTASFRVAVVS